MSIRVYLDNSDFSRLYRPSLPLYEDIRRAFLELAANGVATFCFSYWHIFEFLQPAAPEYLADRRARAEFMKLLCGSNALPFVTDVIAGTAKIVPGVWLPASILNSKTASFETQLQQYITTNAPNRATRRRMSNGSVQRRAVAQKFKGNTHERQVRDTQGLTDEFVAAAPTSRYVKGEISERQYNEALAKMLCDPTYFFEKWFVEQRRDNPFRLQTLKAGQDWITNIRAIAETREKHRAVRANASKARREFFQTLRKSNLPDSVKAQIAQELPPLPPPLTDEQLTLPGIPSSLRYIECYMKHHISAQAAKINDFGDLMHLFYTPDVDLMRCDRAIYDAVRRCPHLEINKLTPALEDIPSRIADPERSKE